MPISISEYNLAMATGSTSFSTAPIILAGELQDCKTAILQRCGSSRDCKNPSELNEEAVVHILEPGAALENVAISTAQSRAERKDGLYAIRNIR